MSYLNVDFFEKSAIDLEYNEFNHPVYPQQFGGFVPNLSIIDLLFNAGPQCKELFTTKKRELVQI
jgi:hypothetical protein